MHECGRSGRTSRRSRRLWESRKERNYDWIAGTEGWAADRSPIRSQPGVDAADPENVSEQIESKLDGDHGHDHDHCATTTIQTTIITTTTTPTPTLKCSPSAAAATQGLKDKSSTSAAVPSQAYKGEGLTSGDGKPYR